MLAISTSEDLELHTYKLPKEKKKKREKEV